MNKGEIIDKMVERTSLKKSEATDALNALVQVLTEALKDGQKVTLVGFGSFDLGYRPSRKGINPSNRQPIDIDEKVSVKFKAGKELVEAVDTDTLKKLFKKEAKAPAAKADDKKAKAEKAEKPTTKKKK